MGHRKNRFALAAVIGGTILVFAVILGAVVLGLAIGPSDEERTARNDARSRTLVPSDVARLYAVQCAACHGPTGQGLTGPALVGVSTRLSDEEHLDVVRNGRNSMPAFDRRLSDAQIVAIVEYTLVVIDAPN